MTDTNEPFELLNTAFWTALLLSGSIDVAEVAVLDGIAAAQLGQSFGKSLLSEPVEEPGLSRRMETEMAEMSAMETLKEKVA